MALKHINENKRQIGPEFGLIYRTDDPKQFIKTYTVQEVIDLNRVESDLANWQETKDLYDLLTA
ncbi:hypothetical protein [Candidatus Magnetobacterium casense]|uniref:Uncharacterized protein n=1 Tax=Candidatus Magnetobacterium casense TaxID=1455061 RepID=A0ABS6S3H8_9BACT|nr:hypothetical protein [Candidatus Magnetobacterium casensis]MBV6343410.1 hypothetical protein [Candidatus Magnetobacterium casensis]